jgi:YVTN family beta-propeller protein
MPKYNRVSSVLAVLVISSLLLSIFSALLVSAHAASSTTPTIVAKLPIEGYIGGIAVNSNTNLIYAANSDANAVIIIDGNTNSIIGSPISVGKHPHELDINPTTNRLYIINEDDNTISVIDGSTATVTDTIRLDKKATSIAVNPATNRIYVSNYYDNIVTVIDGLNDKIIDTISVLSPFSLALNSVTNKVFVGNDSDKFSYPALATIDGASDTTISAVKVDYRHPFHIAVNANTNKIYVATWSTDATFVSVVDGSTNKLVSSISVGKYPDGIGVNPNKNRIYISSNAEEGFKIIDGASNTVISTTWFGYGLGALAVNALNSKIYVAQSGDFKGVIVLTDEQGGSSGGGSTTTSQFTVNSQDTSANPIYGYYTVLSQDGAVVNTGFTPATFTVNNNQQYTVAVQDYGQYVFDHWKDTSSMSRDRTVSISSDTPITAVYKNVNEQGNSGGSTGGSGDASTISIKSTDSANNPINGYYTVLYQNGVAIDSGFTQAIFSTTSGQIYTVEVQDYGSYYFNHWSDGSTGRDKTFTATSSAQTLTAVYSTSQSSGDDGGGSSGSGGSLVDIMTFKTDDTGLVGYYASLWQNGAQIDSCFSVCDFSLADGQTYQIAVSDYGSCSFDHWNYGDNPENRFATVQGYATGNLKLHAYYNCS